jgi:hypothetical protein
MLLSRRYLMPRWRALPTTKTSMALRVRLTAEPGRANAVLWPFQARTMASRPRAVTNVAKCWSKLLGPFLAQRNAHAGTTITKLFADGRIGCRGALDQPVRSVSIGSPEWGR